MQGINLPNDKVLIKTLEQTKKSEFRFRYYYMQFPKHKADKD